MEPDNQILDRIDKFKTDLLTMQTPKIVRKYVTFGECYNLDNEQHFSIKDQIAESFQVHPSEVLVVGSSKLGFSIAQNKRYRHFCDESDIDIAIVSERLFDNIWLQVFEYWEANENTAEVVYWRRQVSFKEYLFRGWIRPDKLPPTENFEFAKVWWEFFRKLTNSGKYGPYKINAGLYKSWHYLEKYQSINVKACKDLEATR